MHRAHVLRAIAATFVPGGEAVRLAERMDETIAALPHREDRDALHRLLSLLESRTVNALVAGRPRAFTAMSPPEREQYLRGWATSRLSPRRKAFQALKRIATVTYYMSRDRSGRSHPSWPRLRYPGPLGPPPVTPKPIQPLAIERDETLRADVVVVGSGAGGGVVAGELAARGVDVVVLERGGSYARSGPATTRSRILPRPTTPRRSTRSRAASASRWTHTGPAPATRPCCAAAFIRWRRAAWGATRRTPSSIPETRCGAYPASTSRIRARSPRRPG